MIPFTLCRQTGHKKKLNTYIGFGETLEMDPFLDQTGWLTLHYGGRTYVLSRL